MTLNRWRAVLIATYVVLASLYSVVTPIFEASDELWHYPMVKFIADNSLALPVQTPQTVTAWRQEGSQPPLYYMMAAVLTGGIDTSDLDFIRRQNPHADIGLVLPDGNTNMIVHRPQEEAFPWSGTVLAIHVARFLSVALGAVTVWVTFTLARTLFPTRSEVIIGATALNAFLPMFLFISGSVNNDNLSNLLGNLLTLEIVLLLMAKREPSWRTCLVIGVTAGAGMLAKFNIGFMLPLVALVLLLLTLRFRSIKPLLLGGAITGGLTILIGGWWYLRNLQLYGDPTGLNVFLDIVGRRAIPANVAQLWAERHSFLQAFWGFFGGVNVPLPAWVYAVFDGIGLIGLIGSVAFVTAKIARSRVNPETLKRALPYAVTLLWIAFNFASYLRWTSETEASQGRLMFGALSSILIWVAVGLTWCLPKRLRAVGIGGVCLWFAGVAIAAPFAVIQPAYQPPDSPRFTDMVAFGYIAAPDEEGLLVLDDADLLTEQARPDDFVMIDLVWEVEEAFNRNWSLFVHLVTLDNVIIGQRDIYPGTGSLALSDLPEGYRWHDRLAIRVPSNAYAPQTLRIELGWYDLQTGERMNRVIPPPIDEHSKTTIPLLTEVQVIPRESALDVPNPTSINFGGLIELVGYEMSDLSPNAGGSVDLTLYWRALQLIPQDYVVFAHIVDPPTTAIYAASDAQPANWSRPTSSWQTGEIIEDRHTLPINPDTPPTPGIYEVEIGLYLNPGDGTFPRLRVFTRDGGMANDYAYLSRVRVLPGEDEP